MSLVTIEKNKQNIRNKLVEIEKTAEINSPDAYNKYIMSQCCFNQFQWVRDNLTRKYISDRHYDEGFNGYQLVNNFFSYMYSHNYIATMDEIYEAIDAQNKYIKRFNELTVETKKGLSNGVAIENARKRLDLAGKLIIEELIDVFHFLLQYTTILHEHQIIMLKLKDDPSVFTKKELESYLTNKKDDMNIEIGEHILRAGLHIDVNDISYGIFSSDWISLFVNEDSTVIEDLYIAFNDVMNELVKLNRDFIRETNFKGWKEYDVDFYSITRFTNLQNTLLKMYNILLNCAIPLYSYILEDFMSDSVLKNSKSITNDLYIDNITMVTSRYTIYDINTIMKVVYAIYMAKRDENIRRQKEDARYKLENTGEAVGDLV